MRRAKEDVRWRWGHDSGGGVRRDLAPWEGTASSLELYLLCSKRWAGAMLVWSPVVAFTSFLG